MTARQKLCACGCGARVAARRPEAIYATEACKTRAYRQRKHVAALAAVVTPLSPLPDLKPSALNVLRVLTRAGGRGATTHELGQAHVGGHRFGARIQELRQAGFRIDKAYERPGSFRYWLREHDNVRRLFDVTRAAHVAARQEAA